MKMLPSGPSLRKLINRKGGPSDRGLMGAQSAVALDRLLSGSSLDRSADELAGRSVLILTDDQIVAALALIELDGIARRLLLCPPGVEAAHIPLLIQAAEIDTIVTDGAPELGALPGGADQVLCSTKLFAAGPRRAPLRQTEWVLVTSGTTGVPKLVVHTLASLTAPIKPGSAATSGWPVWTTFYDIRRYGGLQIFLRALLAGGSLVVTSGGESTPDFLARAGRHGVTHMSGTPSHWRRGLMSSAANRIAPGYVRLSGEIADQPILDDLRAFYPGARVGHAFASTEAGVAFEVNDGFAGFPAGFVGERGAEVEMKIEDGSLRIRSANTAMRYLGPASGPLRDEDGFVDTGDMLDRRGDRYFFVGRRGGIINVGGLKVHPEEVEAIINRHPAVRMSLVKGRKNYFTGAIIVADVVLRSEKIGGTMGAPSSALQNEIIEVCRDTLPPYKVPAAIRFVSSLNVGVAGKLARVDA